MVSYQHSTALSSPKHIFFQTNTLSMCPNEGGILWTQWCENKPFTKNTIFLQKYHWSIKFVLVISSSEYILTSTQKQRFYLAKCWQSCFIFWLKSNFLHQNNEMNEHFYMPLNQYIGMNGLLHSLGWWTNGQTDTGWQGIKTYEHSDKIAVICQGKR